MNTDIISLVDCLNDYEDMKQWDKDEEVLLKLYGSSAILYT